MIGGLRQLAAMWAKRGGLSRVAKVAANPAVVGAASDVGSEMAVRGLRALRGGVRRAGKGLAPTSTFGKVVRSKALRKTLLGVDIASSLGWAGLGVAEYANIRRADRARTAAVAKFKSNLNRTQDRLQRVRRVGAQPPAGAMSGSMFRPKKAPTL